MKKMINDARRETWKKRLKVLIMLLICTAGVMVWNNAGVDNDSWYVLAEGREIVENGVYMTDQLSMHKGLEVTVQNYGFAVIFYLLYSVLGTVGLYIAMLILNIIICVILYKICMLLSRGNMNISIVLTILTDLLLSYGFIVMRAQVVSYIIMLLFIYIMELYIRKGKTAYLAWLPVLSFVQVNLHASLWPMNLCVMVAYIIDSFAVRRLHLQGYKTGPLVLAFIGAIGAGFLNPYGVKMVTFILTSYGVSEANETIQELRPFTPFSSCANLVMYVIIGLAMLAYVFGEKKNIRMRYMLIIFGLLALGLNTIKGMSQLILVLLFPLAEVYAGAFQAERLKILDGKILWRIERRERGKSKRRSFKEKNFGKRDFKRKSLAAGRNEDAYKENLPGERDGIKIPGRKVRWMTASWGGILAVCIIVPTMILGLPEVATAEERVILKEVIDKLDNDMAGLSASKAEEWGILDEDKNADKTKVRLYTSYDHGGYAEFRGYKPYIDPRMEVFLKANNGKEDIFKESVELEKSGKDDEEEFVRKYDFHYIIAFQGHALYELEMPEYEMIYEYHWDSEDEIGLEKNGVKKDDKGDRGNGGDFKDDGGETSSENKEDGVRVYKKVQ